MPSERNCPRRLIEAIGGSCGYQSFETNPVALRRFVGVAPCAYRERFDAIGLGRPQPSLAFKVNWTSNDGQRR
jgi:AraC-like DNA-binding protein